MAPATSSQRKCRLPCFEILPSLSLPPGRQRREELQQLRSADAFADHHHAIGVHAVNLKNRLRDVETDRANLAHGRLPS
jgi:hypothetical protein